ncbi:polysaccharide biosynthesis tyrosine autokinase [Gemmata sp. JC673]|uniref:non-specific protein-tyrosine kinase n=2 Tax=Gemmata algarum TaxID=2975278 RepID=A0ABU5ESI7_9BACT|nr:polysaccharide biosynthesis tyrosine autokinase [Gemmata algarum]
MDDLLQQPDAPPEASSARSGRNMFQVFWQHRGLLLLGLVAGLVLGGLSFSRRQPVYRAYAQVLVVKKQSIGSLIGDRNDPNRTLVDDYIGSHLLVIRSPLLIEEAVRKRDLGSLRSLQGGHAAVIIQAGLRAEREVNKDAPVGASSNIINLSYSGSDPGDCEIVINAIIESYKDFLDRTYKTTAESTFELVQEEARKLTKQLKEKDDAYAKFRQDKNLLTTADGLPFNETKIQEYVRREAVKRDDAKELRDRLASVRKAISENKPLPLILALAEKKYDRDAPVAKANVAGAAALEAALFPLQQQESDLTQFYGEDHPDVQRIRRKIEATKVFYKGLDAIVAEVKGPNEQSPAQAAVNALEIELVLAEGNHQYAKSVLEEEVKQAKSQEGLHATDKQYREDIKRTTVWLDGILKRLQEVDTSRGSGGFNAQAIAPPGPGLKVSPVLWQFIFIGSALGLALGAGGAYLLDMADKSFRTPEEIRRRLGLALIGHVPFVHKPSSPVTVTDAAGNSVELDSGLATVHSATSPEAEAYRGVRTALFFSTHGERHKVIQVTSPHMGDGKTTLIINLAVSIAQAGRKVLLLDADLRRPRVHRAFGLTSRVGLAEVLTGAAELDEAVQVTAIPNLSVLPCGRRPGNPAELLTSPAFEDVLDDLRAAYDYVLVDSPPLLAVSDPCVVAPRVDGLILTLRVTKNGRPAAERARDLLIRLKVNCLGVVVNGVGKQGAMAGYGYDYYRHADDYSSPYTTADHDAHEEQGADGGLPALSPAPRPAGQGGGPVASGGPVAGANGHSRPADE